jgi:transcriptional regulator of acetoin/glycerol metabolism
MVQGNTIDVKDLPQRLREGSKGSLAPDDSLIPLDEMERRHTMRVLETVQGNKTRAAEVLGISRATLYWLIESASREQEGVPAQS